MWCGSARKHLYLKDHEGSEVEALPRPVEIKQAETHLGDCSDCRQFFATEERLRELLKNRAPKERASASLREALLSAIAEQKKSQEHPGLSLFTRRRLVLPALTAILVMAVLVVGYWTGRRVDQAEAKRIASMLVDDHAKLSGAVEFATADRNAVQSWFRGKVDFALRLPSASEPRLLGARLCNLEGRPAALIFYETSESPVSFFVLDGSRIDWPEDDLISIDGKRCFVDTKRGFNAVLWKERGLLYGLVSDAQSTRLLQIAEIF